MAAEKLRAKAGETRWACAAGRAYGMFAEARGTRGEAEGKFSQPVVLTVLQGKGPCGKEAFLLP